MGRPLSSEYSVMLGFSFNKRLGKNLSLWRNAVMNQDIDCCIIIDGPEGAGKSLFGAQVGCFLDHKRKIDLPTQVFWLPDKAKEAIRTLPKFSVVIMDESARMSDRRQSTQQVNIEFNRLLRECRQYNLFLIFILPSFYDMDMMPAVWRTRALLHVTYDWDLSKPETPLKRGFFRFYNEKGKKDLYTNKHYRQRYEYPFLQNKCFDGTFPHFWPFDHEEYKRLKFEAEQEANQKAPTGRQKCPKCGALCKFLKKTSTWQCRLCDYQSEKNTDVAQLTRNNLQGKEEASIST